MDGRVFNPFHLFDTVWGRLVVPGLMVSVLAVLLALSIAEQFVPSVQAYVRAHNVYVTGIVAVLLLGTPALFYWLSLLGVPLQKQPSPIYDTEEQAITALLGEEQSQQGDMDICCYTGPTFLSVLSSISLSPQTFDRVRVLIRHAGAGFRVPVDCERASRMRNRIATSVDLLYELLRKVATRVEIRGYACEPSMRSMTIGRRRGFMTLYTTSLRMTEGRETPDYVSRGKPVFGLTAETDTGRTLLSVIDKRFNDMWACACPVMPRPALVFDFDSLPSRSAFTLSPSTYL